MREEIARLMNLQIADRQLSELEQSLASISGRVDSLRQTLASNEAEHERLANQDAEISATRAKAEKELAEGEARIRNKRMRLNLVRNDKEMQALAHEIDSLKELNAQTEATALGLMEGQEARTRRIAELEASIASAREEIAKVETELAAEIESIKAKISESRAEREKLTAGIEPQLLSRYEAIFERRAGVAIAQVKGGTCMACRRMIPPQLYNEVQKLLQVHFCPSCQRMLYFEAQ